MLRNKLVRSDGSIIDSSVIISCEFTEEVNSTTNLTVGDVTASEITVEIRSTEAIQQGDVLAYYIVEDDVETRIGTFIIEKPTVASKTSLRFSAYDFIIRAEKVFSDWLRDHQDEFPMSLGRLVREACDYCDVRIATEDFPKHDLEVGAFYADNITCRQILSWAAAIAGRFVRANAIGEIEFSWYKPITALTITPSEHANTNNLRVSDDGRGNVSIVSDNMTVTDDGRGNVVLELADVVISHNDGNVSISARTVPYKSGGLSYETYSTDPIQRVQIKHSDNDIGVIYPPDADGNCFAISNNMILGTCSTVNVTAVAEHLYEHLQDISYVPVSIQTFKTARVRAGDIITVSDSAGNQMTTYVMKVTVSPSGTTINSTGDKSYGSSVAVSSQKYSNLMGKVLELTQNVDGLKVANKSLDGRMASLELNTDLIQAGVVGIKDDMTRLASALTLLPDQVEIAISEAVEGIDSVTTSTGYTFDKDGLNIHKSDSEIHNTLDNNGMYVRRGSEDVLTADTEGVNAINLKARQFLIVGDNSRFEDYRSENSGRRTACFWIGG